MSEPDFASEKEKQRYIDRTVSEGRGDRICPVCGTQCWPTMLLHHYHKHISKDLEEIKTHIEHCEHCKAVKFLEEEVLGTKAAHSMLTGELGSSRWEK